MTKFKVLPPVERLKEVFEINEKEQLIWTKRPNLKCWYIKEGDIAGAIHESGYWRVTLDGSQYYCHRIIWKMFTGVDPGPFEVDHINRDRSDNRIVNLRLLTTRQNSLNKGETKTNKTGEPCIFRSGRMLNPFRVIVNGKHLGNFSSIDEAARVRDEYKLEVLTEEKMA
jgi:hypothetical protein